MAIVSGPGSYGKLARDTPVKLSIVDLSPVPPGGMPHDAIVNTVELAQHAERLGYERLWYAEHHGAMSMVGRAPEVLIPLVAARTSQIRVGSGSVLLNHYSPFKVAETFGTLSAMFPGRIDLGAGRATTGPVTDRALQRDRSGRVWIDDSDEQLQELVAWLGGGFPEDHPFSSVPVATQDSMPDLWLLGSSPWSAMAAAELGLRYAFAGFINQLGTPQILDGYRRRFKPSTLAVGVAEPQIILSVHVVCADTEQEARRLSAPVHVVYRRLARHDIGGTLPTTDEAIAELGILPRFDPSGLPGVPPRFIGGTPEQVRETLESLAAELGVHEIMIQDIITDHQARLRSYELLAEAFGLTPRAAPRL